MNSTRLAFRFVTLKAFSSPTAAAAFFPTVTTYSPSNFFSSAAMSSSSTKRRKVDGGTRYYAVKAGFLPGVYQSYSDCQAQTTGFKGALFKSFTNLEDAHNYVAGKRIEPDPSVPKKYYAVAAGATTGVFTDWAEVAEAIKGWKGPKYKRFNTLPEAMDFIREFGSPEAIATLSDSRNTALMAMATVQSGSISAVPASRSNKRQLSETTSETASKKKKQRTTAENINGDEEQQEDGVLRIYTDGSSLSNGRAGSRAGVGVYFGRGDERNISERLEGEPQTNQRAELMAMQRALEVVPLDTTVQILSDSQYSINCVTQWAIGWQRKGWVTATGEKVKNQDIIRVVIDKINERTLHGADTLFRWVKGHSTNSGNAAADRLAVAGARS